MNTTTIHTAPVDASPLHPALSILPNPNRSRIIADTTVVDAHRHDSDLAADDRGAVRIDAFITRFHVDVVREQSVRVAR